MENSAAIAVQSVPPRLGLVCITASERVRFRTLTRKRLLQHDGPARRRLLADLYAENLRRLGLAIDFCVEHGLRLYRMNAALFPFADEPEGWAVLEERTTELAAVGRRLSAQGIRMVVHPDQYVVLSSDSPTVVANSIRVLATFARLFDRFGLPESPWAAIEIHGGKSERPVRLIEVIGDLDPAIRHRLCLENDEYGYSAPEILAVCRATGVPMVFDAHHHLIHEGLTSYDDPSVAHFLSEARTTWPDPDWQLVHISNGNAGLRDRTHSNLITVMPESFRQAPWIEVEAKGKEDAIWKLHREWLGQS